MAVRKIENRAATLKWSGCPDCLLKANCQLYQRLKVSPSFDSMDLADSSLKPMVNERSQTIKRLQILWWKADFLRVICWYGTLFSPDGEVARYERQAP